MLFQAARREGSTEPFKVFPVAALCPRRKLKGKNNKCSQLTIHLPKYPAASNTDRFAAQVSTHNNTTFCSMLCGIHGTCNFLSVRRCSLAKFVHFRRGSKQHISI